MADFKMLDLNGRKPISGASAEMWGNIINDYVEDSTTQPTIVGKINELGVIVNNINGSNTGLNSKLDKVKNENGVKVVQGVPVGGQKYFGSSVVTGAIKIDLPTSKTSTEFNFEVIIDTYQGVFYKLLISGINWSTGFGNSSNNIVRFIGTSTIPNVYFCTGAKNIRPVS